MISTGSVATSDVIPAWLTVELALIPLFIVGMAGIVFVVRVSERVKKAQADATRALVEIAQVRDHPADHHDRLYAKIEHLSNCLHLMMGNMGLEPPKQP